MGIDWVERFAVAAVGNTAPVDEESIRRCGHQGCGTRLSGSNPTRYCRLHNPVYVIAAEDRAFAACEKRNLKRLRRARLAKRAAKAAAEKNYG